MLKQSDLKNRKVVNNVCVGFDYFLKIGEKEIRCSFTRSKTFPSLWDMLIILDRTRDSDSQIYTFSYQLPKSNMDLTMITAIGLKYFQLYLKEEIQLKSNMDFILGDITNGMVG